MNRKNDAELGMIRGADGFMDDNAAAVGQLNCPILPTYHTQLKGLIGQIQDSAGLTSITTQSITATKAEARVQATAIGMNVRNMLYNYGADHVRPDPSRPASADNPGNYAMQQLKAAMAVLTAGLIDNLKDEEVIGYLETIRDKANDIATVTPPAVNPLLVYGFKDDVTDHVTHEITEPGTLTQFDTALNNYAALTTSPRQAISERKIQNKKLAGLYLQGNTLLAKMDNCFRLAKTKNTDLYNGWTNIRKVALQTLATQIVGTVSRVTNVELQTTAVVEGAKITLLAQPYTTKKKGQLIQVRPEAVMVQSDEEGKYAATIKDIHAVYIIKCGNVAGYGDDEIGAIKVKRGKKKTADFLLLPVQSG